MYSNGKVGIGIVVVLVGWMYFEMNRQIASTPPQPPPAFDPGRNYTETPPAPKEPLKKKRRDAELRRIRWDTINLIDEFGEKTGVGAVSKPVRSSRGMSFPYSDVEARIMVNCNDAWIRFSKAPNVPGAGIKDGYNSIGLSSRVDGKNVGRMYAHQQWGSEDLDFVDNSRVVAALSSGGTFAIAFPWYGQGTVAFSWALNGSSAAIKASCD